MARKIRPGYHMEIRIGEPYNQTICARTKNAQFAAAVQDATCSEDAEHSYGRKERTGTMQLSIAEEDAVFLEEGEFYPDSKVIIPPFEWTGMIGIDSLNFEGPADGLLTYTATWRVSGPFVRTAYTPPTP